VPTTSSTKNILRQTAILLKMLRRSLTNKPNDFTGSNPTKQSWTLRTSISTAGSLTVKLTSASTHSTATSNRAAETLLPFMLTQSIPCKRKLGPIKLLVIKSVDWLQFTKKSLVSKLVIASSYTCP
jgi:hypothetical protein